MDWGLAWSTTATGLIVVFAVLIVLIIIVSVLGRAMVAATGKSKPQPGNTEEKPKAQTPEKPVIVQSSEDAVSPEVVAAISAAIAVMLGGEGKAFRIRSVKRIRESRPVWSTAGIQENTRPF